MNHLKTNLIGKHFPAYVLRVLMLVYIAIPQPTLARDPLGTIVCKDALESEHEFPFYGGFLASNPNWAANSESSNKDWNENIVFIRLFMESTGVLAELENGVTICAPFWAIDRVSRKNKRTHIVRIVNSSELTGTLRGFLVGNDLDGQGHKLALSGVESLALNVTADARRKLQQTEQRAADVSGYAKPHNLNAAYHVSVVAKNTTVTADVIDLRFARIYLASSPRMIGRYIVGSSTRAHLNWEKDFIIERGNEKLSGSVAGLKSVLSLKKRTDRIEVDVQTPSGKKIAGKLAFTDDSLATDATVLVGTTKEGINYVFDLQAETSVAPKP